ncbi:hypothetical protein HR51_07110 [Burkholderia cepacia]|nr:hypothetical protein HR51_07110 [Burkholderia cepacia]
MFTYLRQIALASACDIQRAYQLAMQPKKGHGKTRHMLEIVEVVLTAGYRRFSPLVEHAARCRRAEMGFENTSASDNRPDQSVITSRATARMDHRTVCIRAEDRPAIAAKRVPKLLDFINDTAIQTSIIRRFKCTACAAEQFVFRRLTWHQTRVPGTHPRARHGLR